MKIDEGIENLTRLHRAIPGITQTQEQAGKYQKAINLGMEALKFTKSSRDPDGVPPYPLLPGETKD